MKLYYHPLTRAFRVRWLLEELGLPYELVPMDIFGGDCESPEYRAIHPLGLLPALVDGETRMFESCAILSWLADRHAAVGLAPSPGTPARAAYEQWLFFAAAEIDPVVVETAFQTVFLPEERRDPAALALARKRFAARARVLEEALETRTWLLGEHFTAADVAVGAIAARAGMLGLLDDRPALQAYVARCAARPAFARARAD